MPDDDLEEWTTLDLGPLRRSFGDSAAKWYATAEGKRTTAKYGLVALARRWSKARNPLDALEAYGLARRGGIPVPEWVLRFLDGALDSVVAVRDLRVPRKMRPARVAEALGIKPRGRGRRQDAYDAHLGNRDFSIAGRVYLARLSGATYERARKKAEAKFGVSRSVVDRAWARYRREVAESFGGPDL